MIALISLSLGALMTKFCSAVFFVLILFVTASCQNQTGAIEPRISGVTGELETAILLALNEHNVSGLSIALVRGGRVVYSKGFGSRNLEKGLAATADSLFAIGSTTKAFTAAAAAISVDDGLITWDHPIKEVIPEFRLLDPSASDQASLRDLLLHRTGLPRHDFVWYGSSDTREQLLARLAFLAPSAAFRTKWQYQNLMYMVAGISLERVQKTSWEEVIRRRLLHPLEMSRTVLSDKEAQKDYNVAYPHTLSEGRLAVIPFRNIDAIGPAGSIYSSANDMGHWLAFLLAGGKYGGKALIQPASFNQLVTAQIEVPSLISSPHKGDFSASGYGFGWLSTLYRGHQLLWHTGGIDGFRSFVGFFPNADLGIVVLTNVSHFDPATVGFFAADKVLNLEPRDWFLKPTPVPPQVATWKSKPTPRPLTDYEGKFTHPGYGDLEIVVKQAHLTLSFRGFEFPLVFTDSGKYQLEGATGVQPFDSPIQFLENGAGELSGLSWQLEPEVAELVFARELP